MLGLVHQIGIRVGQYPNPHLPLQSLPFFVVVASPPQINLMFSYSYLFLFIYLYYMHYPYVGWSLSCSPSSGIISIIFFRLIHLEEYLFLCLK